ncbi:MULTISPECIES: T9SS type A sorting domain-containing protein [Chryseobacterium]|uniref:Por secretion system C-terminal sorting domain n=1 Tax=Chryseobacterium taihuense TaxID=1141221 RepID=A0A4U8WBG9_9FLAO|nr:MULTISPECIES: T9SS type A sorting domain-containing protein [Chryseobacterium]QQV03829.1 T9SS type A sorting domain-containing protein [Chryseobacterium sp. FDAARGOS 1104]VFB02826.1 Por secretion system C-terminal sorting domain [Chryseobacterium taihuense]
MKKILSTFLLTSTAILMLGQSVFTENFEALNNGNLGTDVTGATAGQNSWYTLYGSNLDYQISTIDALHGKSLVINGYNSFDPTTNSTLNTRIAAKLPTVTATAANNILQFKFEFYTGPSTGTGTAQMRVFGMDGTVRRTIGGFVYNYATKVLQGLATANNLVAPTPPATTPALGPTLYTFNFSAAPGLILTPNTWYTLIYEYNKTTGVSVWKYPSGSGSTPSTSTSYSLITGMIAQDYYFYNVSSSGNTVSNQIAFDNIAVQFGNAATLSTSDLAIAVNTEDNITVYPNPVTEILNIKSQNKVNSISIVDINGRKINVKDNENQIDVRDLVPGVYLISIETQQGITTRKFIKK